MWTRKLDGPSGIDCGSPSSPLESTSVQCAMSDLRSQCLRLPKHPPTSLRETPSHWPSQSWAAQKREEESGPCRFCNRMDMVSFQKSHNQGFLQSEPGELVVSRRHIGQADLVNVHTTVTVSTHRSSSPFIGEETGSDQMSPKLLHSQTLCKLTNRPLSHIGRQVCDVSAFLRNRIYFHLTYCLF